MTGNIKFEKVHKYFFLQHQKTLKEAVHALFGGKKVRERVHALDDLTFEIKKGETVGIIGKNGAGKSTLLSLVAGVSSPTSGALSVEGKISPLIELGAGFHPDLTGKENIFLNGVILGIDEKELIAKFQDIVDFSEIDMKFIYTPVKHYSSGMYMRLAFSVAVFTNPDILLVDEILSVGDTKFREKCMKKMDEFKRAGVTILYVSHNMESVQSFCNRVLYLKKGRVVYDGKPEEGIERYMRE